MQVTVDKETLAKEVHRTLGVVDRKATLPILSHVLMEAKDGGITISATDLEVSFRGFCPAEVQEPGALTLPAHYFYHLIKSLPVNKMNLTVTDKFKLQIQAEKSLYKLDGLPSDQFPSIREVNGESRVEVEASVIREMIEKTIFCCVPGEDINQFSNIFLEKEEKEESFYLRMVTTDGNRLALIDRHLPQDNQLSLKEGVLITRKGALEISRALDGEKNTVGLSLTDQEMALQVNGRLLMVRLLERKFPDYRRIIPEGYDYGFTVDREAFLGILRRISMLSTERFKGVVLEIGPDALEATFENPEVGNGRENLPLSLAFGDDGNLPLRVGFNAKFLLEPLSVMRCEKVLLEFTSNEKPCRISGEGDPDYCGMAMPMSLP
jgi:DNA polymerase-3 subunit beta